MRSLPLLALCIMRTPKFIFISLTGQVDRLASYCRLHRVLSFDLVHYFSFHATPFLVSEVSLTVREQTMERTNNGPIPHISL